MIAMLDVSGDMSLVRTDASYCHYTMLLATRENSASGTDCLIPSNGSAPSTVLTFSSILYYTDAFVLF